MPATRRSTRLASQGTSAAVASNPSEPPPKKKKTAKKPAAKAAPKKSPPPAKRKKTTATQGHVKSPPPKKKLKHTGLQDSVDTSSALGVIDPESNITGTISVLDGEPADAMLVLVDPSKNHDKFFVLQCIEVSASEFCVYSRWGRTGTAGQGLQQDFDTLEDAEKTFREKFHQKTCLQWEEREEPYKGGNYRFIVQDFAQKQAGYTNAKWQYYVDDGVDGKPEGWYDYDANGSREVEMLFHHNAQNPQLSRRLVASGSFTYEVDLDNMTQTNATHPAHTSRRIRRVANGTASNAPPVVTSSSTALSTPPRSTSKAALKTPSPAKNSVAKNPMVTLSPVQSSSPQKSKSHPVDPDLSVVGKNSMDYQVVQAEDSGEWYDVVLNQCNITGGSNNNKYYRIQVVKENNANRFYCWQKWGRVGEPARGSSAKFEGPFPSVEMALKPFCKKFRDKTGNVFGSGAFVPKSGKYTLIEIDNDVEVDEDLKMPAVTDIEYLPSKLEAETKDLVEVLFSKDMRNQALTSFNLDLKKLPLGVPSQQQIQHGVTILDEIKEKLNGKLVFASFDELSSRFYTAIPHSFGRSRPPTINNSDSLQSRYDMCDILSDMYTTNETCRKIATEVAEKKQVPALVDQHYDSLHAELSLVDHKSDEFSFIQTYFEGTKQNTGAKIYNVWRVERKGEKQRHEKYEDLDNRKLLWHGTNVAVVAPILTSGLRIMPHSGGRVGSGIYLANMQEKSAFYTSSYGSKYACMFLAEAALGKEFIVNSDGSHASQLKAAPSGHDSVHAVGRVEPTAWKEMTLEDGTKVSVPQGKGKASAHQSSSFHHDEHLCYDEAQVRLRYVLTVRL